ncbi:MAG: GTP-binding protein [Caldilineales bacterium]|nr:GTP-binding protein [Caldilineales bacterium]MCW5859641.1 GTP-binding protein [Caldilineales bacterium]
MEVIQRKVCLLGDFAVGKTSLARRYVYNKFETDYLATIGVHVSRKEVTLAAAGKRVVLVLWDLAGGETFSQMEASYYRGGAGALLVADVLRPDTFSLLNTYATSFTQINRHAALVFACNKIDLAPDPAPYERRLQELAARWKAPYFLTSALNGAQVEAAFQSLAQSLLAPQA